MADDTGTVDFTAAAPRGKSAPTTPRPWTGAVMLPINSLVFCDWNCNTMDSQHMAALIAEIDQGGFDEPLQVVPTPEGKYLVLGGEHRTRAQIARDQTEVPAVIRNDLTGKTREDLILWSIRRNNLRGRIDEQKYKALEQQIVDNHLMTAEAMRRSVLLDDNLLKKLLRDEQKKNKGDRSDNASDADTEGERDEKAEAKQREALLAGLRTAEQDVLLQSADTVEHGYLFFTQGAKGQMHLVVTETRPLHALVRDMVDACKGESASVVEFLITAIHNELQARG